MNSVNKQEISAQSKQYPPATFFRVLGSWLYDFMLLCALWLLAGFIYIIPAQMLTQIDSSQTSNLTTTEFTGPVFYSYLFFISWFFFGWFFTHGGQTLGLRTWSLQVQTSAGKLLNWTQTLLRFIIALSPWLLSLFIYQQLISTNLLPNPYQYSAFIIAFINLFWILVDHKKRSLTDIFSNTKIVTIPRKAKK